MMRRVWLVLPLLLACLMAPASAQRAAGPWDGIYEGLRIQECRRGGVVNRERIVAEVSGGRITIPALPGDPPLEAALSSTGAAELPRFGLFGEGRGQILEGANNARRFIGEHPGRGECRVTYDLIRRSPARR
jgi:hypothetical protein